MKTNNFSTLANSELVFITKFIENKSLKLTRIIADHYKRSQDIDIHYVSQESHSETIRYLLTSTSKYNQRLNEFQRKSYIKKILKYRIHDIIKKQIKILSTTVSSPEHLYVNRTEPYNYFTCSDRKKIKRRFTST